MGYEMSSEIYGGTAWQTTSRYLFRPKFMMVCTTALILVQTNSHDGDAQWESTLPTDCVPASANLQKLPFDQRSHRFLARVATHWPKRNQQFLQPMRCVHCIRCRGWSNVKILKQGCDGWTLNFLYDDLSFSGFLGRVDEYWTYAREMYKQNLSIEPVSWSVQI